MNKSRLIELIKGQDPKNWIKGSYGWGDVDGPHCKVGYIAQKIGFDAFLENPETVIEDQLGFPQEIVIEMVEINDQSVSSQEAERRIINFITTL